jgi:hypothetical protein
MSDINLHSFNGPSDDGKNVDWTDRKILPGAEIADSLKFSTGLRNFRGYFDTVTSGKEDCVDVNNNCSNVVIRVQKLVFCGSLGVTIKDSTDIILSAQDAVGHGKECDVDIGNWSDQGHLPATGIVLDIHRQDGEATIVRVINGEKPYLMPGSGPYKFVFPWPWMPRFLVVPIFNQLRRAGFFR